MELPLLLQFSIALFTGMVGATFIPPVRRSIPKPIERVLWVALIAVCVIGVVSVADPNARELSASTLWGVDQMINSLIGSMLGGALTWASANRFGIASWMVIVAGADLFALVLLRSRRAGQAWQPRVRLREWMELPLPARVPEPALVPASDPIANLNRRVTAAMAVAGTTMLTNFLDFSIWMRDVLVPNGSRRLAHAALAGRSTSRRSLESLRESAAHLQYAAVAWYAAAGRPAVNGLAVKANQAASHAFEQARHARRALGPLPARAGQVIDIRTLMSAQSLGWYGPMLAAPTPGEVVDDDETEPQRSDRLAS